MDQLRNNNGSRGHRTGIKNTRGAWSPSGFWQVVQSNPKPATQAEVSNRVNEDTARMYLNQEPISGPVTMEEAIARAL